MDRWISVVLGVGVLALAVILTTRGMIGHHPAPAAETALDAGEHAAASAEGDAGTMLDLLGGNGLPALPIPAASGSGVPALPDKAPPQVRFGVVLITFAGAQGAPEHARSPREAHEIAQKLAVDARTDFHGAVVRGDSGSIDDAGRIPRGVLEPPLEYVLFTMAVGAVSDPIDTPRGIWIVKRLE